MAALIDSTTWTALTGQTLTGAAATALAAWCLAVDAALKQMLLPFVPEPITVTDEFADAPPTRDLILSRRPARSITSLYLSPGADGVAANFTADNLLVAGTDYQLLIDDPVTGFSRSGIVRRTDGAVWGVGYHGTPGTLAGRLEGNRGAVKVTYTAGTAAVPADIAAAACMAVTLLMNRRTTGMPLQSESFGGYSYSASGPYTAEGAIRSPEVLGLLRTYLTPKFG